MAELDPKRWPALVLELYEDGVYAHAERRAIAEEAYERKYDVRWWDVDDTQRCEAARAELDARTREKQAEELDEAAVFVRSAANRLLPPRNPDPTYVQLGYRQACADAADFLEIRAGWYRDGCPQITAEQVADAFAVDREVTK